MGKRRVRKEVREQMVGKRWGHMLACQASHSMQQMTSIVTLMISLFS